MVVLILFPLISDRRKLDMAARLRTISIPVILVDLGGKKESFLLLESSGNK